MEAAIRARPGDLDGYEVYADWLLEHGEPHGEVISFAVRRARSDGQTTDDLAVLAVEARLLRDRERVFGTLGSLGRGLVTFDLELGFLSAVRIYATREVAGRAVRAALTERAGAFLRDLSVLESHQMRTPWVNEDRPTARAVWDILFDVGVPDRIGSVALPLAGDDLTRPFELLAHVPRCGFSVRNISAVAEHLPLLRALDTLTITTSAYPTNLTTQLLLDAAPVLAGVPNVILAGPAWVATQRAIRDLVPHVVFT